MAINFFITWALWEKMTFVLGCLICLVFCAGLVKLWWMGRISKRHAILDEEKKIRTRDLRNSGLIEQSDPKLEIPFGVRAIESGIAIDGIWISRPNTPASDSLKLLKSDRSSDMSRVSSTSDASQIFQQGPYLTIKPQPPYIRQQLSLEGHIPSEGSSFVEVARSDRRSSHEPRRSSQLRFSSYGEPRYDEVTIEQLGGNLSSSKELSQHKDESSRLLTLPSMTVTVFDDSTEESDPFSGSSSSSTQVSSSKGKQPRDGGGRYQPIQSQSSEDMTSTEEIDLSTFSSTINRTIMQDISAIPGEQHSSERMLDLASQMSSPHSSTYMVSRETNSSAESHLHLLSQGDLSHPTTPTFGPGDIHMNRVARKVNPGFEVLPAGTFGPHPEFMTAGGSKDHIGLLKDNSNKIPEPKPAQIISGEGRPSESIRKKSPRKLQKKERRLWKRN